MASQLGVVCNLTFANTFKVDKRLVNNRYTPDVVGAGVLSAVGAPGEGAAAAIASDPINLLEGAAMLLLVKHLS